MAQLVECTVRDREVAGSNPVAPISFYSAVQDEVILKDMAENKRIRALVTGRVQGIGYRWFVQDTARALKINGWVKNLYDGSVEISAEGTKDKLDEFLAAISKHNYASISSVESEWEEAKEAIYKSFDIKF